MNETQTYENDVQKKGIDFRSAKDEIAKRFEKTNSQITAKAEDVWEDVVELVKKHPGKALGIAVAAGAALGSLAALSTKRQSTSDKIRNFAGSSADAWGSIKAGFEEAVSTLKDLLEDAAEKLK